MDKLHSPKHRLIIRDNKRELAVNLKSNTYSIGRDLNNPIVLNSPKISRCHATLLRIAMSGTDDYRFRVIDGDLNGKRSKNGIKVNGKRCFSYDLEDGDVISFCDDITATYYVEDVSLTTEEQAALFDSGSESNPDATGFIGNSGIFNSSVASRSRSRQTIQISNEERQASIQQSLERLASFPELFSEPIIEIDFKGNITYLNPATTEYFPTLKQDRLRHPILAKILDLIQNCDQSRLTREVIFNNRVFEQSIHSLASIQVIRIYISDITKRKKAERLLKQSQEILEKRVKQRTLELNESNQKLQHKISRIQRVEQEVRLLQTITQEIAGAESFDKAIGITMRKVCKTVDWSYAEAWIPDLEENVLKPSTSWYDHIGSSPEMRYFRQESVKFTFAYNQGKPGRVWATKKAEWTKDVSQQSGETFLRNSIAQGAKLRTALGVPMISKGEVIAVFVFFDSSARVENTQTIQLVTSVVAQLGLFVARKRAEDALRSSMATNKAILNAIPDLILRVSREGIFVNYKAAKKKNLLTPEQNFVGKHIYEVFPEEISLQTMNCIERAFTTGEVQLMECQIEDEGKTYSYEVRIALSDIEEVMAIVRDISDRKQAEADIRQTLAQQRHLNELKSRFVTMASHEFRTPLTSILSSAELLEHYGHKWGPEKQYKYLHRIQSSVMHMTELLNDVLLLGKADAGKLELNPTNINLFEFCQDLVEEMATSNPTHQIVFNSKSCSDAGGGCGQNNNDCGLVCLDEKMLRHIINNLLSNAIKYSPDSDRVIFDLLCQPQQAILRVQDFGIGVPPAEQSKLFDSFHRAGNVGSIPGTGLGLPIVKRSVDLHGGTITVDSQLNVGTTFTVTLPYLSDKS